MKIPSAWQVGKVTGWALALIAILFGSIRFVGPKIFGLDTDLMFVLMPVAILVTVVATYVTGRALFNSIKEMVK